MNKKTQYYKMKMSFNYNSSKKVLIMLTINTTFKTKMIIRIFNKLKE